MTYAASPEGGVNGVVRGVASGNMRVKHRRNVASVMGVGGAHGLAAPGGGEPLTVRTGHVGRTETAASGWLCWVLTNMGRKAHPRKTAR